MSVSIELELSPVFQTVPLPSRLSVDLEEATVRGLLNRLCELGGEKVKALLLERGGDSVLSGLMVMVNDQIYTGTALNQQTVPLHSGDKVSLLYFVSGG